MAEELAPDVVDTGEIAAPTSLAGTKLVLVDGSGFIFRAYHALPPMSRADGTPVNAVFGFSNMLARLLRDHVGTHLAVIFDAGRTTFRNRMYAAYKAHRPEPPEDLVPQFALVREATAAFGVPAVELADWEADDLIASYAREIVAAGGECTIISSDKDLMQLLGPGVEMLDPIKQKPIGTEEVLAKFGVPPDKVVEVQALMGDSVDNVPGVPGIGPKTAGQLVAEYGDVEAILAAAPSMKPSKRRDSLIEHAEAARISRRLVELDRNAPLPLPIAALAASPPDARKLGTWLDGMGFRSIAARLSLPGMVRGEVAAVAQPDPHAPAPDAGAEGAPAIAYGPYPLVSDAEGLAALIGEITRAGIVAIAVQTDSTDARRSPIVGLGFATGPGRASYLPLRHEGDLEHPLGPQLDLATLAAALRPVLEDPSVLKVFHNAKFDNLALHAAGLPFAAPLDDTMLISYAQDAGAHGHALGELAARHLGHTPATFESVTGTGRARLAFSRTAPQVAGQFAAEAADATLRLWRALRPGLRAQKSLSVYELLERRLVPIIARMEQDGIAIDAAELGRMSADFGARMAVIETEIHELAGRSFNLGSPKQLGEILFDEMGLPGGKRMKTGAWGTDSSVLQALAEQGHVLPARILDWRQLAKLKSTYADSLVDDVDPSTRRVHTTFQMAVTTTGRLSSNAPNLQNIPIRTEEGGRIRQAFIAAPGKVLVSADYSQIELRLLAHVADIPALRESFRNGEDIHTRTASEVFGVPMAGMDSLTRRRAKAINFGIIYGISAFGLARQLGIEPGEAKLYIDQYFRRYPAIRDYMETTRDFARTHGYVLTPFGRRCWIPGIAEKNPARRAYGERQAINAPLQGGAADIIKRAMVRLPEMIEAAGLSGRMLLQVHDELLFESPVEEAEALAVLARDEMQRAASLAVPLVVETGIGRHWGDAH